MKQVFLSLTLFISLVAGAEEKYEKFLREVLNLQEDKVDLCEYSFILAQETKPDLDKGKYLRRINDMAEKIRFMAMDSSDPYKRVNAIVSYVHEVSETKFDKEDIQGTKSGIQYLYSTLDTKSGNFKTMPILVVPDELRPKRSIASDNPM